MSRTLFLMFLLVSATIHAQVSLVQESSAQYQFQSVQADGYWGGYQQSRGLGWSLGVGDPSWAVRAGLHVRQVTTSAVFHDTVYPGYQGWGADFAADVSPFHFDWLGAWSYGATIGASYEYLSYPGLFREFELLGFSLSPMIDWQPEDARGFSLRLRAPIAVDRRLGFSLAWRGGVELALVLRGGWGQSR